MTAELCLFGVYFQCLRDGVALKCCLSCSDLRWNCVVLIFTSLPASDIVTESVTVCCFDYNINQVLCVYLALCLECKTMMFNCLSDGNRSKI